MCRSFSGQVFHDPFWVMAYIENSIFAGHSPLQQLALSPHPPPQASAAPTAEWIETSATTGTDLLQWLDWDALPRYTLDWNASVVECADFCLYYGQIVLQNSCVMSASPAAVYGFSFFCILSTLGNIGLFHTFVCLTLFFFYTLPLYLLPSICCAATFLYGAV